MIKKLLSYSRFFFSLLLVTIAAGFHSYGKSPFVFDPTGSPGVSIGGRRIPVLCYHQIRDWKPTDSKSARVYIVPLNTFKEEMKALHDSGFHTVSPDQMTAYLLKGTALPSKPVLLTFDDGTESQYENALPELNKYGFKATFFIMTVTMNRPHYLSKAQIVELSNKGHVIGSHTWNHKNVRKYDEKDWAIQIEKPTKDLEKLVGKPVKYFAFPFGIWNHPTIEKLKQNGFTAAFQLIEKQDEQDPMYTIRRILVDGNWNTSRMLREMRRFE